MQEAARGESAKVESAAVLQGLSTSPVSDCLCISGLLRGLHGACIWALSLSAVAYKETESAREKLQGARSSSLACMFLHHNALG